MTNEPARSLQPIAARWLMMVGIVVLAGCAQGPSAAPAQNVEWVLPNTSTARECANQCEADQWRCNTRADDTIERCQVRARRAYRSCEALALDAHQRCADRLRAIHGLLWTEYAGQCVQLGSACNLQACDEPMRCDPDYQRCFRQCGGTPQS